MNNTAIEAGVRAARVLIHAEHKPTTPKEIAALDELLGSLRAAMKEVADGSVFQAVQKVLRMHAIGNTPLVSAIPPDRRKLLASRIARGFAIEHIRSLGAGNDAASTTGGAS